MPSSSPFCPVPGFVCLGVSHRTAPVELRERYTVRNIALPGVLHQVCALPGVKEAVIISTCNRVEYYLAATDPACAAAALQTFLNAGVAAPSSGDPLYRLEGEAVADHLFRVAAGLDSMVIGESEILGQLRLAYAAALEAGTTGPALNRLFQHAFRVSKALRTTTGIARGNVSVGSVAVALAESTVGSLDGRHVMILGAGETSSLTARALRARGVRSVIVSNRSFDRAEALARELEADAIHFSEWPERFSGIDILISSTSAPRAVVTCERLGPLLPLRELRPLLMIDLAVPRDIEPAVGELPGIHLCDIDSLQTLANAGLARRRSAIAACEPLIREETAELLTRLQQAQKHQLHSA